MADLVYTYAEPTVAKDLARAQNILGNDGLIVYPSDVNWALACEPASRKALGRLRQLKPAHPREQPFTLLCNSLSMISQVAVLEAWAYRILKRVLPGPYTFLLRSSHSLPRQIKDRRKIVGVRWPKSALLHDLIEVYGGPLLGSSLPLLRSDEVFGYEVDDEFGNSVDLILDLGAGIIGEETAIIDLSSPEIVLKRQGCADCSWLEELQF